MGKYDPLANYLDRIPKTEKERVMRFSEIEEIIQDKLPPSARKYSPWWGNERNGSHSYNEAWLGVGWEARLPDFKNETITFIRKGVTGNSTRGIQREVNKVPAQPKRVEREEIKVHTHRSTASFGKRQEFVIMGELLRRGLDVYMTLVDDQQIDCIIRMDIGPAPHYLDIQIKARSNNAKNAALFAAMDILNPRPSYYYIFYSEQVQKTWVIPSLTLVALAHQNKAGKNKGKFSIDFCHKVKGIFEPDPQYSEFEEAFHLLI
jgi:hypothetical protein